MAKKLKRVSKNHLHSKASFNFALNIAVLAVLVAVLVTMVTNLSVGTRWWGQAKEAPAMMGY
jgi:uncharacterized membrane protein (DUF106 family)